MLVCFAHKKRAGTLDNSNNFGLNGESDSVVHRSQRCMHDPKVHALKVGETTDQAKIFGVSFRKSLFENH